MAIRLRMIRMKFLLLLLLSTFVSTVFAQNKVVVIPLGSDVSSQQFNDLVKQVNSRRVYNGVVLSNGFPQIAGSFTSSRLSEGIYRVRIIPPVITTDFGDPAIVITSRDVHRVPAVTVSKELIDDQILYVEFDVHLRAINGNLANARFSFHFQFAEAL